MKAGFSDIDITPPIGTHKIGWIIDLVSDQINDPLYAHVAVFEHGTERVAFISLDTLSLRWTQVQDIRARIEKQYGFPGSHIMLAATHNHAGPAVAGLGRLKRDETYIESLVEKCVAAFGEALASEQEAELGFAHVLDFNVAKNRRVVMRDGTVKTHHTFEDLNALCIEGPMDPEVAVLAARDLEGRPLGALINYACHPTHFGGGTVLSAGYPGVLVADMKEHGYPTALFLNGACGNTHTSNPVTLEHTSMEEAGQRLAQDARKAIETMSFEQDWPLGASTTTVQLPYRTVTPEQVAGTVHGAQRFVDPTAYDDDMPQLVNRIETRKTQPAEVQTLFLGNLSYTSIPAEYFVEHGLRIKEQSHPRHALVVSQANGMVGYVPTRQAFERGGYETTFAPSSKLAPEAGDILADAAIAQVRGGCVDV